MAEIPGPKDASPITAALNRAVLDALPFADTQDFDDARQGFIATLPEVEIKNDQGRVVWTLRDYSFLADEHAPATVNPSLWRLARLNLNHGLFQVTDRIYQIRGFDISNMSSVAERPCSTEARDVRGRGRRRRSRHSIAADLSV